MWDASKLEGLQIICATMTDQMLEPCQAKKNWKAGGARQAGCKTENMDLQ